MTLLASVVQAKREASYDTHCYLCPCGPVLIREVHGLNEGVLGSSQWPECSHIFEGISEGVLRESSLLKRGDHCFGTSQLAT